MNSLLDKQIDNSLQEYIKTMNQPYIESIFAEQILSIRHKYKNIYKYCTKRKDINTLEQFEIYEHHKRHKNEILDDQIIYNYHKL